jgi:biofilm protein TabA
MGLYLSGEVLSEIESTIKEINKDIPDGKYSLIENDLYFKVLRYKTKEAEWITEAHRKYIDIQIVLTGVELLKIFYIDDLQTSYEYDNETDVILYNVENSKAIAEIRLTPGFFCVFFLTMCIKPKLLI